jgi:L-ascorbate metabolism protein UlaG (beta-lactamase superfamily)
VDLVMVPVGGTYTVDAAGAKQVCEALAPTWIVPMHYRHAPFGLPNVGTVGDFLALWRPEQIHRLEGPSLELPLRSPGVWVPEFV